MIKSYLRKNRSFFLFILVLFAFRWSFADQYHVPTGSMEPTIHVGDRIFVNKLAFDFTVPYTNLKVLQTGEPERGDIIVFRSPEENGMNLVKRLIGLPGDHIVLENGFITINGEKVGGSAIGLQAVIDAHASEVLYREVIGKHVASIKRLPSYIRHEKFEFDVPP